MHIFSYLEIKLSIDNVNSMVKVWLENHHSFDVFNLIEFVEKRLELQLDSTFFNSCAQQLSRQGDFEKFNQLEAEIIKRDLVLSKEYFLTSFIFFIFKIILTNFRDRFFNNIIETLEATGSICKINGIDGAIDYIRNYRKIYVVQKSNFNF